MTICNVGNILGNDLRSSATNNSNHKPAIDSMAFDKKLIKTIRFYPILYENKPFDVQHRIQKDQAWEEVSIVMNQTGNGKKKII